MKTRYRFIHFVQLPNPGKKTEIWSCRNNATDDELGKVKYYGPWRQYCYFPSVQAVYSVGCLDDIRDFIGQVK